MNFWNGAYETESARLKEWWRETVKGLEELEAENARFEKAQAWRVERADAAKKHAELHDTQLDAEATRLRAEYAQAARNADLARRYQEYGEVLPKATDIEERREQAQTSEAAQREIAAEYTKLKVRAADIPATRRPNLRPLAESQEARQAEDKRLSLLPPTRRD